jgi:hypothetical protein
LYLTWFEVFPVNWVEFIKDDTGKYRPQGSLSEAEEAKEIDMWQVNVSVSLQVNLFSLLSRNEERRKN